MKINACLDNPVVRTQEKYHELADRLTAISPYLDTISLMKDRVIIENIARRTFRYPSLPTIDWIVSKLEYMLENNL